MGNTIQDKGISFTTQYAEKYMKISDFLIYILKNKEQFLGEDLHNGLSTKEEKELLSQYIKKFMLQI